MIATLGVMGRKKTGGSTTSIRVSENIARMIEIISTAEGVSSSQICDPILEPVIRKRYDAAMKSLADEQRELAPKPVK